jgi:hypothetical protein
VQGLLLVITGLVQRMGAHSLRLRFVENVLECSKSDLVHLIAIIAPLSSCFVLLGHVMLGEQVRGIYVAREAFRGGAELCRENAACRCWNPLPTQRLVLRAPG